MAANDANDIENDLDVQAPIIRGKLPYADFWGTTQMQTVKVCYMWTIKDFSSLLSKEIDAVFTEEFSAKEAPHVIWQLVLKIGSNEQEDLQLELHHIQKHSVPYKVFLKAQISILNVESERKHVPATFEGFSKEDDKWNKADFVSKALLIENTDDLLPENSLTLFCEILQSGYFNTQKEDNVPVYECRFSNDFSKLFENYLFSDAKINVLGTIFNVHKAVVAARCPIFWILFDPDTEVCQQDVVVQIKDVQPKVFREILRYMYTGEVENIDEIVCDLIIAADNYSLDGLKVICEKTMYDIINVKNALDILVVVDQLGINLLKRKVLKFIKSNLADVIKLKRWEEVQNSHVDLATEIIQMHITQ